ncbi:chorismate mutase [Anaerobacillus arseniciselenatis]|uniref:chorismate mutase n=1 Tax=Anaerobacillus arseniciselenatis TaxID=85682 RepID=A0A1S2LTL2_9BACI|nr:chorismate mutase [Anaerobacillus arseniciselenatis]OIJ15848.1 chorismate mutase [Anaerobacillus arseniciselenatis]
MVRGIRGAITVNNNNENEIVASTERLLKEMIEKNQLEADIVAHVMITVTEDLNAAFPAKALRSFTDWTYVPVMCSREIPVPNSLQKCIRVMLTVNTDVTQQEIKHVYLEEAVHLRPDLTLTDTHNRV